MRQLQLPFHTLRPRPQVLDVCGLLINLRTAIMRYRKPKTLDKFFRWGQRVVGQLEGARVPHVQGSASTYIACCCLSVADDALKNLPACPQAGAAGAAHRLPARLLLPGALLHAHRLCRLPGALPEAGAAADVRGACVVLRVP